MVVVGFQLVTNLIVTEGWAQNSSLADTRTKKLWRVVKLKAAMLNETGSWSSGSLYAPTEVNSC